MRRRSYGQIDSDGARCLSVSASLSLPGLSDPFLGTDYSDANRTGSSNNSAASRTHLNPFRNDQIPSFERRRHQTHPTVPVFTPG